MIGAARLPVPGWANGLIFGLLLSLPDAIITKAYAPILGLGAIGGLEIGIIIENGEADERSLTLKFVSAITNRSRAASLARCLNLAGC